MLHTLRKNQSAQWGLALVIGFGFGFLLQRGGVCHYDVIMGQLLLENFTVLKVMLSASVTGMLGIYALRSLGWITLHKKSGSLGATIPGPLIFGIGFGILGYCPGTAVGAVGHGALDALAGGVIGILLGAGLYAVAYPVLKRRILPMGDFGDRTLVDVLPVRNPWPVVVPVAALIVGALALLEKMGL